MLNKNNQELIEAIKIIAKDHNLDNDVIFNAIACGFEMEARKRYGVPIRAVVDHTLGNISLYNVVGISEKIQNETEASASSDKDATTAQDDNTDNDVTSDKDVATPQDNNTDEDNSQDTTQTKDSNNPHEQNIYERDTRYIKDRDFDQYNDSNRACADVSDYDIKRLGQIMPPLEPNRSFIALVRRIIAHSIKTIEKEREYNTFKDKVGEIVVGVVRKIDVSKLGSTYGVILDLGGVEATLEKKHMLRNDSFKIGSGVKVLIEDVSPNKYGSQITLSRTSNTMLSELMKLYINEINDGVIEVISVARQPGVRSKVAVISKDAYIDPVMTCVGHRGVKIKSISEELQGEKIDVILWSDDTKELLKNALGVSNIEKMTFIDEERVNVLLDSADISLAIGARGQNIRLASKLTGLKIDIMTEDVSDDHYIEEFNKIAMMFMSKLDLDEMIGQLLAAAGYTTIDELHQATTMELLRIEGFDADTVQILKDRAKEYKNTNPNEIEQSSNSIPTVTKIETNIEKVTNTDSVNTEDDTIDHEDEDDSVNEDVGIDKKQ